MNAHLKKAGLFIALTFASSWGLAFAVYAIFPDSRDPKIFMPLAMAYMFTPMLSALVVQKVIYREKVLGPLGVSFKPNAWFGVAWILPLVLALAALWVGSRLPGMEWSWTMEGLFERLAQTLTPEEISQMRSQMKGLPMHPLWWGMILGLLAGATVNAVAGFGEELGWRGLLQKELGGLGFWRSSIIIGLLWGIWHAPLILKGHNYPQHPREGVFFMTYFTVLYAPLFSYIRLKAKSVLAAALLHGTLNGTAGLSFLILKGGTDLTVGITGLAGLAVLAAANILLYLYDRFVAREKIMTRCAALGA